MTLCNMSGNISELYLEMTDIENVTFGFYNGGLAELRSAVARVDEEWVRYFNEGGEFFCGFLNGSPASFCIIGNDGETGDIGCVGTLPEFRRRGIGLETVKRAALVLKERGCERITVRKTHLAEWYGKLGFTVYETVDL